MKKLEKINWHKLTLELIVVFLGVTSGFVLNNWRESRKNIQLEQKYIESFIHNIDSNIVEIEGILERDTVRLKTISDQIKVFTSNKLNDDSIVLLVNNIIYASKVTYHTSTFDDIKYSGNLNLLRNYGLKELIVSYHNFIESSKYVDSYNDSFFNQYTLPFAMNELDVIEGKLIDNSKRNKNRLISISLGYHSMLNARVKVLEQLLEKSFYLNGELTDYLEQEF